MDRPMLDPDVWHVPYDFGGAQPMTLAEMRESAAGVIARSALTSASERDMARCVMWLVGQFVRD